MDKNKDEKIIEEFRKSNERMEKFINENLNSKKSPIREKLRNLETNI